MDGTFENAFGYFFLRPVFPGSIGKNTMENCDKLSSRSLAICKMCLVMSCRGVFWRKPHAKTACTFWETLCHLTDTSENVTFQGKFSAYFHEEKCYLFLHHK